MTKGEVAELVKWLYDIAGENPPPWASRIRYAAYLLERQQPVAVRERLPGPDDCAPWPYEPEAPHWCWVGKCDDFGWKWLQLSVMGVSTNTLARVFAGGGWTHWLPHDAFPLPIPTS